MCVAKAELVSSRSCYTVKKLAAIIDRRPIRRKENSFAVCKLVIKAGKMFSSASNDDIERNFSAFSDRAQFALVRFLKHAAPCGVQS